MSLRFGVALGQRLGKVAHGRRQLTLRAAELLEHEGCQTRVRFGDSHRVLQTLVVDEHKVAPERVEKPQRYQHASSCRILIDVHPLLAAGEAAIVRCHDNAT